MGLVGPNTTKMQNIVSVIIIDFFKKSARCYPKLMTVKMCYFYFVLDSVRSFGLRHLKHLIYCKMSLFSIVSGNICYFFTLYSSLSLRFSGFTHTFYICAIHPCAKGPQTTRGFFLSQLSRYSKGPLSSDATGQVSNPPLK